MASIKVAVRVRPISAREVNLTGSDIVVRTDSNEICLTNLKVSSSKAGDSRERTRKYAFDYCFDSSDPEGENFADQARIYRSLGHTVLDAVFAGYNSCLVAYGQSASGKTYTMMGSKDDPGLTPRLCQGLFERIDMERKNDKSYSVSVSYLEIYNEKVRDLLKPSSSAGGLRVREHPRLGPYVQGLTRHVAGTLGTLMSYVEDGTRARKTASTLQNPSSSRSHALLTIAVTPETQGVANAVTSCSATRKNEIPTRGGSKLRLVDLAGSESAATCSGVHRLKEGANINKSLVALGNVISALAERGSTGSGPGRRFIPYRDSSLTWLLKDALGGNATTIMLATISPASGSYNETAHTLRFAQRAQSVVNRPVVNEDPVARVIRELRAEVARLKSLLLEKNIEPDGARVPSSCCCRRNEDAQESGLETETPTSDPVEEQNAEQKLGHHRQESSLEAETEGSRSFPVRRSSSSDRIASCEVSSCSASKKFGSLESLSRRDHRLGASYNRAKVRELGDEDEEIGEYQESVFVDIPTLVAVLIKPDDDSLQQSTAQIEEICSEEPIDEFIERTSRAEAFEQAESIEQDDRNGSGTSAAAPRRDNEAATHRNPSAEQPRSAPSPKLKEKAKFLRKQDSVDLVSAPTESNLATSKRFGSAEAVAKKDPALGLARSQTNLEKRSTVVDGAKRLKDIREIEDRRRNAGERCLDEWRDSRDQLERKGSNDSSDKSLEKEPVVQAANAPGQKLRGSVGRKFSSESLKRKTSKDSSSSSSKDEQIPVPGLARDKLVRRKSFLEQEAAVPRSHTPIQRAKRAEIVAAVTERLYASRKQDESASTGTRSPPESNPEAKSSLARLKLQEISRKMLGKRRRVCADTQTDCARTIRVKDSASSTETAPATIRRDVGVLTDDHATPEETCGAAQCRKNTPVRRVKETATLTEKPGTEIVRFRDVASSATDLDEHASEVHSFRNDSGILSDDARHCAESDLSSSEVQEAGKRAACAESSTNTSAISLRRSLATQAARSEDFWQQVPENEAPRLGCCDLGQRSENHSLASNAGKRVISIHLPDAIDIAILTNSSPPGSRIVTLSNESTVETEEVRTRDEVVQTEDQEDVSEGIPPRTKQDQSRPMLGQTDGRGFRIENIFQDPNNAGKVDPVTGEARLRNSITFRTSLGTSYVPQSKEQIENPARTSQPATPGKPVNDEGFIRDGLITEAFIGRRRGCGSRKPPSSMVYRDPWRNWQLPVAALASTDSLDFENDSRDESSFWQSQTLKDSSGHDESSTINPEEASACAASASNVDHEHGFSDDSLDYSENNPGETFPVQIKESVKRRDALCPPDVVAHTNSNCPKTPAESLKKESEGPGDFNGSLKSVEFSGTNALGSREDDETRVEKSLRQSRPSCTYEEVKDESSTLSHLVCGDVGKKQVSFSSAQTPANTSCLDPLNLEDPKPGLKSIMKKRRKKIHSSNEDPDDSWLGERIASTLSPEQKAEARPKWSEESRGDRVEVAVKARQSRKKVKFSVVEESAAEDRCSSESDSFENVEDEEAEDEEDNEESPVCARRNILQEYLCQAAIFMRNLNAINQFVNSARHPPIPCRVGHGRRATRRGSCSSGWSGDHAAKPMARKISAKSDVDHGAENVDIVASTESYERCMKGIERLEECIRRVDRHSERLKDRYGVDCESARARPDLARPSIDRGAPFPRNDLAVRSDAIPASHFHLDKPRQVIAEPSRGPSTDEREDLEKRIFDQLMSVANSISYRGATSLRIDSPDVTDSGPPSGGPDPKLRERKRADEAFSRDAAAGSNLDESDTDRRDFTVYEITGNLSVGKPFRKIEESDDDLSSSRRLDRSTWSDGATRRTLGGRDDNDDNDKDDPWRLCGAKGYCSSRDRSRDADVRDKRCARNAWPRARACACACACACAKDHSSCADEPAHHSHDKVKYPGSPRARFLELLRERRRIVEWCRGTSAS